MTRVRMLESARGAEDGIQVKLYEEGEEYDLSPRLARIFISGGKAKEVEDRGPVGPTETQVVRPPEVQEGSPQEVSEDRGGLEYLGGGWYELPDGRRVRGKDQAEKMLKE